MSCATAEPEAETALRREDAEQFAKPRPGTIGRDARIACIPMLVHKFLPWCAMSDNSALNLRRYLDPQVGARCRKQGRDRIGFQAYSPKADFAGCTM